MAQVAEVEVAKDGAVRVRRVVCAVDCGTVVNPDTVRAQIQSAIIFGITAALHGEITLKNGRVEQTNFDTYQMLRIDEAPAIEVHIVQSSRAAGRHGRGRDVGDRPRGRQRDLCGDRQAPAKAAGRRRRVEAGGVRGRGGAICAAAVIPNLQSLPVRPKAPNSRNSTVVPGPSG